MKSFCLNAVFTFVLLSFFVLANFSIAEVAKAIVPGVCPVNVENTNCRNPGAIGTNLAGGPASCTWIPNDTCRCPE